MAYSKRLVECLLNAGFTQCSDVQFGRITGGGIHHIIYCGPAKSGLVSVNVGMRCKRIEVVAVELLRRYSITGWSRWEITDDGPALLGVPLESFVKSFLNRPLGDNTIVGSLKPSTVISLFEDFVFDRLGIVKTERDFCNDISDFSGASPWHRGDEIVRLFLTVSAFETTALPLGIRPFIANYFKWFQREIPNIQTPDDLLSMLLREASSIRAHYSPYLEAVSER